MNVRLQPKLKPQVQITIRARETVELTWRCGMAYASALPVNPVFSVVRGGVVCRFVMFRVVMSTMCVLL